MLDLGPISELEQLERDEDEICDPTEGATSSAAGKSVESEAPSSAGGTSAPCVVGEAEGEILQIQIPDDGDNQEQTYESDLMLPSQAIAQSSHGVALGD